jgi:hypothetical protein
VAVEIIEILSEYDMVDKGGPLHDIVGNVEHTLVPTPDVKLSFRAVYADIGQQGTLADSLCLENISTDIDSAIRQQTRKTYSRAQGKRNVR